MKKSNRSNLNVLLSIVIIIIIVTIGYMMIYANNPFIELANLVQAPMMGSLLNQTAPAIVGTSDWLNVDNPNGLTLADLKGKVVLLDFWTYSCINCIRTLPYLTGWDKTYRNKGLVIIGVHTPEFRFEKESPNVQAALKRYNIEYPVTLDNNSSTWHTYRVHYWPTLFLIDKNGTIVYRHIGEGAYAETEQKIQALLTVTSPSP